MKNFNVGRVKLFFPRGLFVIRPSHGPQVWPWWRIVTVSLVALDVQKPSFGWALWWYTRWGGECVQLYVDRRHLIRSAA